MIRPCSRIDAVNICSVINDGAEAYRSVIPQDRWHEPYMPLSNLLQEIERGVEFHGHYQDEHLVGVMGIEAVQDVSLIRHAYVCTTYQGRGVGSALIDQLLSSTRRPLLVGTWAAASWAISFYQHRGFTLVTTEEKDKLLDLYWSIPSRQRETSVVLVDESWRRQGAVG